LVRAFRAGEISGIYNKDMLAAVERAKPALAAADCHEMMVYGVTNHGGAPTKKAIADIHTLENDKDIEVKFSTVAGYFDECGEPLASFSGEMITGDFGPYTNGNKIKKLCREAEYSLLNAERAAIVARELLGREYPKAKFDSLWRDVMFNQFHDILGGASIKEAYTDAYNGLGRAILGAQEITHFALQSINKKIKTLGKNPENPWNIVVWNLNETDYDGYIEAEIQWLHEFPKYLGGLELEDESGKRYECQIILERSVITGFRSRVLFKAIVPSLGYKSFKVIKTDLEARRIDDKSFDRIKTDKYELTIDSESGYISRFDTDFVSLLNPICLVCLEDAGDTWFFNAERYGESVGKFTLDGIKVIESGALRRIVKATYRFLDSVAELYYTFYNKESYFDIKYRVNFSEKHKVLKLVIDSGLDALTVSSPFASEKRCDTAADMPMGEWLVASGDKYSVSVISSSVFSYTKNGGSIELSLLRSCIHGDLRIGELDSDADYTYMEQGITEGEVRIEISKTADCDIAARAKAFNNPTVVISDANHDGYLSPTDSFAKISAESVSISAIKRAEDSEDIVIRLNEYAGREQTAKLCVFDKSFEIKLDPFEIKTLLFTGESLKEVSILEKM
jgi:alpha-mannosidase